MRKHKHPHNLINDMNMHDSRDIANIWDKYERSEPDQRNRIIAGGLAVSAFGILLKFLTRLV